MSAHSLIFSPSSNGYSGNILAILFFISNNKIHRWPPMNWFNSFVSHRCGPSGRDILYFIDIQIEFYACFSFCSLIALIALPNLLGTSLTPLATFVGTALIPCAILVISSFFVGKLTTDLMLAPVYSVFSMTASCGANSGSVLLTSFNHLSNPAYVGLLSPSGMKKYNVSPFNLSLIASNFVPTAAFLNNVFLTTDAFATFGISFFNISICSFVTFSNGNDSTILLLANNFLVRSIIIVFPSFVLAIPDGFGAPPMRREVSPYAAVCATQQASSSSGSERYILVEGCAVI